VTNLGLFAEDKIDELPQIFIYFLSGDERVIGHGRCAKNEKIIIDERDKDSGPNFFVGISGYAQYHGRNHEVQQKCELGAFMQQKTFFALDVKVFFLTIKKICLFEVFDRLAYVSYLSGKYIMLFAAYN
jgi:lipopolysaccharide/colanic/teichoic acid biosynthesis glycosyltransferase